MIRRGESCRKHRNINVGLRGGGKTPLGGRPGIHPRNKAIQINEGFTGCGKTLPPQNSRPLCNKGTASAGPQASQNKASGFSPCATCLAPEVCTSTLQFFARRRSAKYRSEYEPIRSLGAVGPPDPQCSELSVSGTSDLAWAWTVHEQPIQGFSAM